MSKHFEQPPFRNVTFCILMSVIFCQQWPGEPIAAFHLLPVPHAALHLQKKSILPVRLWFCCPVVAQRLSVQCCCLTAGGSEAQTWMWPFCVESACPAIQRSQCWGFTVEIIWMKHFSFHRSTLFTELRILLEHFIMKPACPAFFRRMCLSSIAFISRLAPTGVWSHYLLFSSCYVFQ